MESTSKITDAVIGSQAHTNLIKATLFHPDRMVARAAARFLHNGGPWDIELASSLSVDFRRRRPPAKLE